MIDDSDLDKAYTAPHEKTVKVPEKWHGAQLNRIERAYGGDAALTIQEARIQGAPRVVIEERK